MFKSTWWTSSLHGRCTPRMTEPGTFPCLPLKITGFPDTRSPFSPFSPLHAFLIDRAPRVTWADRLARPRILRRLPWLCCHASLHSFSGIQEPGTVNQCQGRIWQCLVHCQHFQVHRQAATSPSGPHDRHVRKHDCLQQALRGKL